MYLLILYASSTELSRDFARCLIFLRKASRKCKNLASFLQSRYNQDMEIIAETREETIAAAERFAVGLQGGDVVLLSGELGAGKTTFTKGIGLALGVTEPITSPTFTIIKEYRGKELMLYHMDMYRISDDLSELGLEEYLGNERGVTVIEWCQTEDFHARIYEIELSYYGEGRKIVISGPKIR